MKTLPKNRRGSGLLAAILMAMVVATLTAAYLETATTEYKSAMRSLMMHKSINVAESGAEEAIYAINSSDYSGWDVIATDVYYRAFSTSGSVGETYNTYVVVDNRDPELPELLIEGEIDGRMFDVSKQLKIRLAGSSGGFGNGVLAKERIQLGGNQIMIDSYDGAAGPYNYYTNRGDNVGVATLSVRNNDINIQHGDIWGYVSTGGGDIRVGKNGSILGEDSPTITSKPAVDTDRVSRDFYADLPDVEKPSMSVSRINSANINGATTWGSPGTSSEYYYNDLSVGGGAVITVEGDVTLMVDSNINMNGTINVQPDSTLKMYIKTLSLAGGGGIFPDDGDPSDVQIYGTSNQPFNFNGGALTHAVLYTPNSQITMAGGGHFYGSVVGKVILLNGNWEIHYDERLSDGSSTDDGLELEYWRELTEADEKLPLKDKLAMAALYAQDQ